MLERVQLASWDNCGIVRHRYIGICSTWRMAIKVGWLLAIRRRDCCSRRTSTERTHVGQRLVCKELQSTDTFHIWQVYLFAKQLSNRLFISMLLFVYLP